MAADQANRMLELASALTRLWENGAGRGSQLDSLTMLVNCLDCDCRMAVDVELSNLQGGPLIIKLGQVCRLSSQAPSQNTNEN